MLRATADRLTAWAGPGAAVGRLGGDEFAIVLRLPHGRREVRLAQLVRMLRVPVLLDDGQAVDVAASVGAAALDVIGTRDLSVAQRAADAALYDGKHSGRPALATTEHAKVPSINGRRAGRPGTAVWGEPHERRHPAPGRLDPRHHDPPALRDLHPRRKESGEQARALDYGQLSSDSWGLICSFVWWTCP